MHATATIYDIEYTSPVPFSVPRDPSLTSQSHRSTASSRGMTRSRGNLIIIERVSAFDMRKSTRRNPFRTRQ